MPLLCLDVGHGTDTIGKRVPELKEHTFNSEVVKYAIELAKFNNFDVLLTQPLHDLEVPLIQRTNLANSKKADLLISFHADANEKPNVKGHWVFYWHNRLDSKKLANIWSNNALILPNSDRGVVESKPNHWTNFHMVREPNMPSILIEHAFYTNKEDLQLLLSENFRKLCAEVAIKSACEYFDITFKKNSNSLVGYTITKELPIIVDGIEIDIKAPMVELFEGGLTMLPIRSFLQDILRDKWDIDLKIDYDGRVLIERVK